MHAWFLCRLRNRSDSEDLTQEVALRALPRLREGAVRAEVRTYLFRTAHSVLADFWSERLAHPTVELHDDAATVALRPPRTEPEARVHDLLSGLAADQRRVLELRFLRGLSLREVAVEMRRTTGAIKQLQLRALRAAARTS